MEAKKTRGRYEYVTGSLANPLDNVIWFSFDYKLEAAAEAAAARLAPLFEALPPNARETLKCVLANLYAAWHRSEVTGVTTYVAVSLDKNCYVGVSRYAYPFISHGRVRSVLNVLDRAGNVVIHTGFYDHDTGRGRVTRIIAGEELARIFAATEWEHVYVKSKYSVMVRDEEKRPCPPPNREKFLRMCKRLDRINRKNAGHEFAIRCGDLGAFLRSFFREEPDVFIPEYSGDAEAYVRPYAQTATAIDVRRFYANAVNPYTYTGGSLPATPYPASPTPITNTFSFSEQCKYRAALTLWEREVVSDGKVDIGDMVHLTRKFNDRSLELGGRFYCPVQNLPKEPFRLRSCIAIDGEPTVELDFVALHIQMLYAAERIKYRGDPYEVEGFDRATIKSASLIAINARSRPCAVAALRDKGVANASGALRAFEAKHPGLRKYFYSGIGKRLQYKDSCIAERVILAAVAGGEGIIPVHDSFIVRASFEGGLRRAMVTAFKEEYGVEPVIKKK